MLGNFQGELSMHSATCVLIRAICSINIAFVVGHAHAQGSLGHSAAASMHASQAVRLGIAGSGQVALGVSAAPLVISGAGVVAAGLGVAIAGSAAARLADSPERQPLPVSDETVTAMSPAAALKPASLTDQKEQRP